MHFKIHRGTHEIGGSCVEIWTDSTRIVIDFGMPLIEKDGSEFNFRNYKDLSPAELINQGVLPDIKGLYNDAGQLIDGLIISHAHQDHFGLLNFMNPAVKCYLGEATHKIIELNNLFTPQTITINYPVYFTKTNSFDIGDISLTAYWADHSAFDAYSFLVEAEGKRLFYSGDFRSHGRKANAFKWFTHNAPLGIDYLLLEGTNVGKDNIPEKTETDIEDELIQVFKQGKVINLVYASGQNIDRLVSIYRACIRTDKILVVDVYVASVLKALSRFANIPYPSVKFRNLKVIFPRHLSNRLSREGKVKILYQFTNFKITKEEISEKAGRIVMMVRPSMQFDLDHIPAIEGGNIIYSMWKGYLKKSETNKLMDYLKERKFSFHYIHTSGHADIETLKKMVEAVNPKHIIPIHTLERSEYQKLFTIPVSIINDRETIAV